MTMLKAGDNRMRRPDVAAGDRGSRAAARLSVEFAHDMYMGAGPEPADSQSAVHEASSHCRGSDRVSDAASDMDSPSNSKAAFEFLQAAPAAAGGGEVFLAATSVAKATSAEDCEEGGNAVGDKEDSCRGTPAAGHSAALAAASAGDTGTGSGTAADAVDYGASGDDAVDSGGDEEPNSDESNPALWDIMLRRATPESA